MDYLTDILNQITGLKGMALIAVCLIMLGYVLKAVPQVPNAVIPAAVILGGMILTPVLTSPGEVSPEMRNPIVGLVLQGFLIGVASWFLHDKALRHLEGLFKGKAPLVLALLLPLGLVTLGTGCRHLSAKANTVATLEATQAAVHEGMNTYGAEYRAGRVSPATSERVRRVHADYRIAFDAACVAVQFDLQSATPDQVKALAVELLNLIHELR